MKKSSLTLMLWFIISALLVIDTKANTVFGRYTNGGILACCQHLGDPEPIALSFDFLALEVNGPIDLTISSLGTIYVETESLPSIGNIIVSQSTEIFTAEGLLPSTIQRPDISLLEASLAVTDSSILEIVDFPVTHLWIRNSIIPGTLNLSAAAGVVAIGANVSVVPLQIPIMYFFAGLVFLLPNIIEKKSNKSMISLAFGQLGRLTARFFNVLVSLHLLSALQRAPYANR